MKRKNHLILYSFIFGIVFYILDSLIYYLIFAIDNQTFTQVLITAVPNSQLYGRLLMLTAIIVFGVFMSGLISNLNLEIDLLKDKASDSLSGSPDTSFISSLSYQIRTPLNAIVGFSELLKNPDLPVHSRQNYINHVHTSGKYLLHLINNVVDISKIEANQLNVEKTEFDVNELLDEIFKYFDERKKELGKSDLAISLKKISKLPFIISTDRARIKQVLINLIENAVKHTSEGFIEYGYLEKEKGILEFYIQDTGRGFSMDRLEVIFNRYKRLSDNHNQPFDGSALRLTISKSLLKLLGGDIWADSKVGKGSTFYFTIPYKPLEKANREDSGKKMIQHPKQRDWQNYTILIAEDIESNFIYLQELLKPTNAELVWVQNGKQAVEYVENNQKIDLVLMDILMPEMDGHEATRKVKEIRKQLPVIAQTAYNIEGGRESKELKNFDGYLLKPIWSNELMGELDKYLSS